MGSTLRSHHSLCRSTDRHGVLSCNQCAQGATCGNCLLLVLPHVPCASSQLGQTWLCVQALLLAAVLSRLRLTDLFVYQTVLQTHKCADERYWHPGGQGAQQGAAWAVSAAVGQPGRNDGRLHRSKGAAGS
jgi:hypothetical protein